MSRPTLVFTGTIALAAFGWCLAGEVVPAVIYWGAAIGAALFLALAAPAGGGGATPGGEPGDPGFLCDRCRYDHGDACTRPDRPNAKRCGDFRRR